MSINHLSKKVEVDKNTIDNVLYILNKIGTISMVQKGEKLNEKIRQEYKILLGDTNKYFVYTTSPEIGTIREAFFVSEIKKIDNFELEIELSVPYNSDFRIRFLGTDKIYNLEIGGKNKQVGKYTKGTFIIKDNIIVANEENVIPLWLFGFLS